MIKHMVFTVPSFGVIEYNKIGIVNLFFVPVLTKLINKAKQNFLKVNRFVPYDVNYSNFIVSKVRYSFCIP